MTNKLRQSAQNFPPSRVEQEKHGSKGILWLIVVAMMGFDGVFRIEHDSIFHLWCGVLVLTHNGHTGRGIDFFHLYITYRLLKLSDLFDRHES